MTASKLLAMAVEYLNADRKSVADIAGQVDVDSFAQPPQPDCEPQQISAQLPMVTGSKQVHEIPIVGKFWPQGDPDRLRKAGQVWRTAANVIDQAQINAGQRAAPIPVYCSSSAVTAFTKYVTQIYDPDPSGGTTLADGQPLMENLSAACRQMSAACHDYADAIDICRHTIEALAIGAGIITAVGIIGTIFTLGGSDAAAAAGDGVVVGEAAAAADALAAAEADSVAAAAVGGGRGPLLGSRPPYPGGRDHRRGGCRCRGAVVHRRIRDAESGDRATASTDRREREVPATARPTTSPTRSGWPGSPSCMCRTPPAVVSGQMGTGPATARSSTPSMSVSRDVVPVRCRASRRRTE